MENPFILSDDKLKVLLDAFSGWSKGDEKERKYTDDHRQKAEDLKKTLLNKDYLSRVSRDELVEEILKYSKIKQRGNKGVKSERELGSSNLQNTFSGKGFIMGDGREGDTSRIVTQDISDNFQQRPVPCA